MTQTLRTSRNPDHLRKLRKLLRQVSTQPLPGPVHQLRTTIRRTETFLSSHGLSEEHDVAKLLQQLTKLRRRAGRVRDVDVQIAALRATHMGRQEETKARLMAELERQRSKQQKRLLAGIEDRFSDRMRARMRKVESVISSASGSGNSTNKRSKLSAARLWRSVKDLIRTAHQPPSFTPGELHQFRIRCKKTRYLAELLPGNSGLIQQLKTMQDSIGDWHDWLTLTQNAAKVAEAAKSPLLLHLENVTQAKFTDAIRVCRRTVAELEAGLDALKVGRDKSKPEPEKKHAEPEKKKVQPEKDSTPLQGSSSKQAAPATG